MEILMQGQMSSYTVEVANEYLKSDLVDRVVISCWENDPEFDVDDRILIVRSKDVENPGIGNRNRQILSSREGLKHITQNYCAKMRTDQLIRLPSIDMMDRFYQKFKEPEVLFEDGSGPYSKIFVLGDFPQFPFHPRDHVFWGDRRDLVELFDIPFDEETHVTSDDEYATKVRSEAYIAQYYWARFDSRIKEFIENPATYLTDAAPLKEKALEIAKKWEDKIIAKFPRVSMAWPKFGLSDYHYHAQSHWEKWHDDTGWLE